MNLGLSLSLTSVAVRQSVIPPIAITLNGRPITLNGRFIALKAGN